MRSRTGRKSGITCGKLWAASPADALRICRERKLKEEEEEERAVRRAAHWKTHYESAIHDGRPVW